MKIAIISRYLFVIYSITLAAVFIPFFGFLDPWMLELVLAQVFFIGSFDELIFVSCLVLAFLFAFTVSSSVKTSFIGIFSGVLIFVELFIFVFSDIYALFAYKIQIQDILIGTVISITSLILVLAGTFLKLKELDFRTSITCLIISFSSAITLMQVDYLNDTNHVNYEHSSLYKPNLEGWSR